MSSLLALIANAHRDPKKTRAFKPGDFDPFAKPTRPIKVGVEVLKDVFLHGVVPEQALDTPHGRRPTTLRGGSAERNAASQGQVGNREDES
ncbi:MAG: hypothetical protein L6Q92_17140 [Phycisphaerae bacterium]|nr:hypothetical protein [Phycisphaerae bacterium]